MIEQLNFNGELFRTGALLFTSENRSFRYGDGLFESIRMINGKMPFLNLHFQRLSKGMEMLKMNIPSKFTQDFIAREIRKMSDKTQNARIRLTVFRKDGGLYLPESNSPFFLIEGVELEVPYFVSSKGIKAGLADAPLTLPPFSNLKTNNALPYVLGKIEAHEKGLDELILFNDEGGIMEGTASNIFVLKKGEVLTPPLSEGCLDGVMRQFIIQNEKKLNLTVIERPIPITTLMQAEEIWLTNAIRGIQPISSIGEKTIGIEKANQAVNLLNVLIKELTA